MSATLEVIRSTDLCRTVSPKMIPKRNKRRKSSSTKATTPDTEVSKIESFELGLSFVKASVNNINNNNNNNNNLEKQELATRRYSRHRKLSGPAKLTTLVASN